MSSKQIKTIEEAKGYFICMGCSHFHMARENPPKYEAYKKLNITKYVENKWKTEQVENYYNDILEENNNKALWHVHSIMADLVQDLKNVNMLFKLLEVTQYISDKVPLYDRVIVSETINGRLDMKCRSGLIYLAYDLNCIDMAKKYVDLSLHFSNYIDQESRDLQRCRRAMSLCNEIKKELRL